MSKAIMQTPPHEPTTNPAQTTMPEYYIDNTTTLEQLCNTLQGSPWLALDTEFIREKTYYPQLCLLQISNGKTAACIDPLAINQLQPLLDILYDPQIVKVWHAARQDLEIFQHHWHQIPTPLFDTQMAAAQLDYGSQIGYANLVKHCLNIDLPKDQSRTDWAARPLNEQQIRYALDDVIYLGTLYLRLNAKLTERQQRQLNVQQAVLLEPETYAPKPEDVWRKIKGRKTLRGAQQQALQTLAAWRENQARQQDVPRKWLMTDHEMLTTCRAKMP
jgi:ribonuclease D